MFISCLSIALSVCCTILPLAKRPVSIENTHTFPLLTSATFFAVEAPPPPPVELNWYSFELKEGSSIAQSMEPIGMYAHIKQAAGVDPKLHPEREFDVIVGSRKDTESDINFGPRARARPSEADCKNPLGRELIGKGVCNDYGYLLVSGKAPFAFGRRVRASSDGTQFAIEYLWNGTIRVYLISTAPGKSLDVYLGEDGKGQTVRFIYELPQKGINQRNDCNHYVEMNATGALVVGVPTPASQNPRAAAFLNEMKKIRDSSGIPMKAERTPSFLESNETPAKFETLLERFKRQIGAENVYSTPATHD